METPATPQSTPYPVGIGRGEGVVGVIVIPIFWGAAAASNLAAAIFQEIPDEGISTPSTGSTSISRVPLRRSQRLMIKKGKSSS